MMDNMKQLLIVLFIFSFAFVPFVSPQEGLLDDIELSIQPAEVVVFVGHPKVKIVAAAKNHPSMFSEVPEEKTFEFRCEIVKRGKKYYWKSRDAHEVKRHLVGAFVEFRRLDRSDYVRIANSTIRGEPLAGLALRDESILSYHYVEHLTLGLTSINYWGSVNYETPDID